MVFINMLTTVWKREIDELRVAFKVQVRDLPPQAGGGPTPQCAGHAAEGRAGCASPLPRVLDYWPRV